MNVRQYVPVSDEVVRWHLRGKDAAMKPFVMGLYPMLADESVRFAVIDFDKSSWRRDALLVVKKARAVGLSVALEKSRSGKGAHLWFFLESAVSAKNIREVLTYVMTLVLEECPEVGLDSYDRIIPNQDTLPKGGFGNLIALPLQAEPRKMTIAFLSMTIGFRTTISGHIFRRSRRLVGRRSMSCFKELEMNDGYSCPIAVRLQTMHIRGLFFCRFGQPVRMKLQSPNCRRSPMSEW